MDGWVGLGLDWLCQVFIDWGWPALVFAVAVVVEVAVLLSRAQLA